MNFSPWHKICSSLADLSCLCMMNNGWANPFLNFIFKTFIENKIPESTAVGRQTQDLGKKLRYPYREIL